MHFMSRVFSNTTSLMTSVCMLYIGAMAASIILPAKSRSDVMFCLQSYGTYLSWQDKYTIDL